MFFGDLLLFILILVGIAVVAVFLNKRLLTLLLSSLFLLLVAMRLNVPYMYLMGTVLLALPLTSYLVGWAGGKNLTVQRQMPEAVFEGETALVRVDIHSVLGLFSGFARVSRRLPRYLRHVPDTEQIFPIEGGLRHEFLVRPERRGVYGVKGCTLLLNDPLGIFLLSRRFPDSSSMTVYPVGVPAPELYGLGESSGGWLMQAATRRGDEEGFHGTREYRVGDDLRRIHWRSSARLGELVVVEREQGARGVLWLALDTRAGSERGTARNSSFELVVKWAVTLMEAALAREDAVGLIAAGPSGAVIPPAAGEDQRWRILEALARVKSDADQPVEVAVQDVVVAPGSTIALLTAAPTEAMAGAIPALRDRGLQVVAVPIELPGPAKPAAWPTISGAAFAAAAEDAGGAALWRREETMPVETFVPMAAAPQTA
jgi:uncharacterized protein (DUF58 family)